MICLKNIYFSYKDNLILENINVNIETNSFVSIVGKSGCGKTTLLNILSGHLTPNKGEVVINEKPITKPGKNIIVINQENDLFDWMTVNENLELICDDLRLINKYLVISGLYNHREKYPKELSGGMKKKLSIIRAMVSGGEIILMDEIFSSLDYFSRESLYKEILHIFKTTKKTMILVTHDIDEALCLANKVLVLKENGKDIVEIEVPTESKKIAEWENSGEYLILKNKIKKELH